MPSKRHGEEVAGITAYTNPINFFLMGVFWGAVIGGVLGVLYAPMKGSETRQIIKNKAEEAVRLAQAEAEDVRARADEVAGDIREKAIETRKKGEEMLKSFREGPGVQPPT